MEDDKQNDRPQHDEEDDEEEGGRHVEVLMHAAYADDGATPIWAILYSPVLGREIRCIFRCALRPFPYP